jgi:hypothetical protein
MDGQEFDHVVTATARAQAQRLREFGFSAAAAEVDALLPAAVTVTEDEFNAANR